MRIDGSSENLKQKGRRRQHTRTSCFPPVPSPQEVNTPLQLWNSQLTSIVSAIPTSTQAFAKPTKPALVDYVENVQDSKILLYQVQGSILPHSLRHQDSQYFGDDEESIKTSMLPMTSDTTSNSSLPALTRLPTPPGVTESVSDGFGERQMDRSTRVLVPRHGGALEVTPLAPFRSSQQDPILECPFPFLRCYRQFAITNEQPWLDHSMTHFVKPGRRGRPAKKPAPKPPKENVCCFCDEDFESSSGVLSWQHRMSHVKLHHERGHRMAHARLNFALVEYMWEEGLIEVEDYRELKPGRSAGQAPSGSGTVASINENGPRRGQRGPRQ